MIVMIVVHFCSKNRGDTRHKLDFDVCSIDFFTSGGTQGPKPGGGEGATMTVVDVLFFNMLTYCGTPIFC